MKLRWPFYSRKRLENLETKCFNLQCDIRLLQSRLSTVVHYLGDDSELSQRVEIEKVVQALYDHSNLKYQPTKPGYFKREP